MMCPKAQKKKRSQASQDRSCYPSNHEESYVHKRKRMLWLKKLLLKEACFRCTVVWRSTSSTRPQLLQKKVTFWGKSGNSNKMTTICWWTWQHIPPGKDRWLATPISLGLSWPLTSRHLLGVASHLRSLCSNVKSFISGIHPKDSDRISTSLKEEGFYLAETSILQKKH